MGADGDRHVMPFGLEVTDDAGYAQYRAAMAPFLALHGGAFGCDFVVARVLKGPNTRINRLFTLTFPSSAKRDRFFADEEYRSVRDGSSRPSVRSRCWRETSPDVARPTWVGVGDAGVVTSMSPSPKTRGGMGAMGARRHDKPGKLAKRSKSDAGFPSAPGLRGTEE
jgi:uncharacterized protein (DUF1330 family)